MFSFKFRIDIYLIVSKSNDKDQAFPESFKQLGQIRGQTSATGKNIVPNVRKDHP